MIKVLFYKEGRFPTGSESHIVNKIKDVTSDTMDKAICCGGMVNDKRIENYLEKLAHVPIHYFSLAELTLERSSVLKKLKHHFVPAPIISYPTLTMKLAFESLFRLDQRLRGHALFHSQDVLTRNFLLRFSGVLEKINFHLSRLTKNKNSLHYFLYSVILEEKPAVVDCCYGWDVPSLASLKRKVPFKLVVSIRGKDLAFMEQSTVFNQMVFQNSDLLLVRCDDMRKRLIDLGYDQNKVIVNHSGVDLGMFPYRPISAPDLDKIRLFSVGRLTRSKGQHVLLAACRELKKRSIPFQLDICGEGEAYEELQNTCVEYNIAAHVRFRGYVPNDQLQASLAHADIVVHPALTPKIKETEGIPVALMEAMAAGVLCISTFHAGIPELISHGVTGYLVEEDDSDSIVERVQEIYRTGITHEKYDLIRNEARKKIECDFDSKKQSQQYVQLVKSIL